MFLVSCKPQNRPHLANSRLSFLSLFTIAFCMIPGIICGIRGYKRFDKSNRMDSHAAEQGVYEETDPNNADYDDRYKQRKEVWGVEGEP
jgi:hypothetical protein